MGKKRTCRKWTREEDIFLRENIGKLSRKEMSEKLGRTYSSIKTRLHLAGLDGPTLIPWTDEEVERLRSLLGTMKVADIAKELGRGYDATHAKMSELGLKSVPLQNWTREEEAALYDMAGRVPLRVVAQFLGRSFGAVESHSRLLGINWRQGQCTQRELAKRLGVSDTTVKNHRRKTGIPRRGVSSNVFMFKGRRLRVNILNPKGLTLEQQLIISKSVLRSNAHTTTRRVLQVIAEIEADLKADNAIVD